MNSLYDDLVEACLEHGPLIMDICACRQCGWEGFVVVPRRKGFEGSDCPECHKPGIDQVEVDP